MFGIGTTEVLLILAVALLVIGPSKLPDVARALGKGMAEFRRMSSDVKKTIDFEAQVAEMDKEDKDKHSTDAETGKSSGAGGPDSSSESAAPDRTEAADSMSDPSGTDWSEVEASQGGTDRDSEETRPSRGKGESGDA